MNRQFLAAGVLVLQLSLSTLAQQPTASPQPQPPTPQQPTRTSDEDVVRINTNLVQVDAVITDKNGKPVIDLKPGEVQISEDGKRQKITHFSYVVAAETTEIATSSKPTTIDKNASPAPPVALKKEQVRRTIAIIVDDLGLSSTSVNPVRGALKKFVDDQMLPNDLVAIIRTAGGIGALQQFTADKRQLHAAIERIRWYAPGRGGMATFAPIEGANSDVPPDVDAANDRLDQFHENVFAVGTLGAIDYVLRGLRELPGRKSILLISDGFGIYSPDDQSRSDRVLQALQRSTDLASRASVVIYTMNATRLQTLGLTAADYSTGYDPFGPPNQITQQLSSRRETHRAAQEGLDYLAKETGGLAIRDTNDLGGGIRRVMEDQKGYYLIGYRPDESTFDPKTGRRTFHKLSLKVTRAGDFTGRMRNGFYGITDEEAHPAPRTPQEQAIAALTSPFGANGIHLQLTSLFANDPKKGSFMRSMLHIKASDLQFTDEPDGSHKARFDVVAVTFGDNGTVVDQIGRTYTIRIPAATYDQTLREGFVYYLTVPVKKPGAYQLRTALRDEKTERVGSASQYIEVPDVKKNLLALSGLVLAGIDATAFNKQRASQGASAIPASAARLNADDQVDQTDPETSPALRHFHPGQMMKFGYVIYNAQSDKTTGQPRLQTQLRLFRNGQPVFTGREEPFKLNNPPDLKRLSVSGAIHLGADLVPGEYMFQVVVTDLLADQKNRVATQWIDFEIVK